MIKEYDNIVRCAFGYIEEAKLKDSNWSVKVSIWPMSDLQATEAEPPRYGGQHEPTDNDDGNGEWISLEDTPASISLNHSTDIKGKFVRILYTGNTPWHGWAKIIKEPGTEDMNVTEAEERGLMRTLSANSGWI